MYFESIIGPMTQYPAAMAVGAASVMLCAGFKAMGAALQYTAAETANDLAAHSREVETTLAQLRARISDTQPPGGSGSAGMEQEKRTLALAMLHSGESPEMVAAALGAPRNEIELLMKVHRILKRQAA